MKTLVYYVWALFQEESQLVYLPLNFVEKHLFKEL